MFDVNGEEQVHKNYDWFCAFDSLYGTTGLKTLSQSQFPSSNFCMQCSFIAYTFAPWRSHIQANRFWGDLI